MSRLPPKLAKPVEYQDIIFKTEYGHNFGHDQDGGLLVAIARNTQQVLWSTFVYVIDFDELMEKDVQERYITSIKIAHDGSYLLIENEGKQCFKFDLKNHVATLIDYDF